MTDFKTELLPPPPIPLPVKDSLDSLLDIIEYLEKQYKEEALFGEGEEGVAEEGNFVQTENQ